MVFLPGDHALDTNITVANVVKLTICGESGGNRAAVVCKGPVGFTFTSTKDLKICSLAFTFCSRNYGGSNYLLPSNYALLLQSAQYAEVVNCSFRVNIGSALIVDNTNITLAGNSEFTHNHCTCAPNSCTGGRGLTAYSSNLTFIGNTTFLENSALSFNGGGAIYADNTVLSFEGTSNFISNSADFGCGAISTSDNTILAFNGTSNFIGNSALLTGGAICTDSTLMVNGIINFINNSAGLGGAMYTSGTAILSFNGISNFIGNSAIYGGAIRAGTTTTLTFNGTTNFFNNGHNQGRTDTVILNGNTTYGGGVFMTANTSLLIFPNTTVYWVNNHATFGGAIYVADATELSYCTSTQEECFFQLPGQNLSSINVQLVFKNNSAGAAGSVLYGGAIDNCKLTGHNSSSPGEVFDHLVHIDDDNTNSSISSFPFRICHCDGDHPDCSVSSVFHSVYPGEMFSFSVVGVGQRNGKVPAAVKGSINTGNLLGIQYLQHTKSTCTTLNYTVFSLHYGNLELYADGPCSGFSSALNIHLTIHQNCPPGFSISMSARSCVCEPRLARYTNNCNITNGVGQITRDPLQQFWVGYDDDQLDGQSDKLILNPFCPFDYCTSKTVVFSLNNADIQCAYKRSGLLCGACKDGYSLVLGTSHCRKCTNSHLTLLIAFALMGVVLVCLLLVCKLTVATGTLSGLVFYANIVGANRIIFLPVESTNPFLSVFIAWLNLDFGIETCFYNGLDVYSKTWLQFVFPVYIWLLVGLIILVSHYSRRFAKLLGSNPVSVLATLILLSYTTILRTLIAVIYVTYLEYPTYKRWVWLYDANIEYLSGKHIPLFIVAVLVFLFLFLPYTFLLLFGQWLQAISHLRLLSWVNSARLKPFIDSYHAPYQARHRYWPGLLLVLRFVLLLVFAFEFNPQQDTSINLLAILVVTGILHFWAWISGGVYRNWYLNVLEGSFALNLIILAASTYHVQLTGGNQLAAGNTSVSIAFATFIGILIYHILQQLRHMKMWKKVPKLNLEFNRPNIVNNPVNSPVNNPMEDADFDQLREPLLEDQPQAQYGAF